MKKVLIITYYWPPAGGPGVQRVLKFAKYLPQFGWQPVILTVKKGEYPAYDTSLEEDVHPDCKVYKTSSWEPAKLYKKFTGMAENEPVPVAALTEQKKNWKKKLAHWIRLNLFIPDAKIGWIPFAVKAGKKIIKREKPDLIFSSSPPPTVHLIARKLAKWSKLKWVADFRDPWTEIYHLDGLTSQEYSRKRNLKLEIKTLLNLHGLTTVSEGVANLLLTKVKGLLKYKIIPNGYDENDLTKPELSSNKYFTIAYAGNINMKQNPSLFWKVLKEKSKSDSDFRKAFRLLLMGNISEHVLSDIKEQGLEMQLEAPGYLSHPQVIKKLFSAIILLLLIPNTKKNEGIITGKLYEYLHLKKPVLGFGPIRGEAAKILENTKCGTMFEYNDRQGIEDFLESTFRRWINQEEFSSQVNEKEIQKYSRRIQTFELAVFFKEIL
jgi:glycosyltransferase involved in cell wall biosynthesis